MIIRSCFLHDFILKQKTRPPLSLGKTNWADDPRYLRERYEATKSATEDYFRRFNDAGHE